MMLLTMIVEMDAPKAVSAQQGGANLLVNGDFEWWDWDIRSWPFQDGVPEVQICPGWRAFYVDTAPDGVPAPEFWKRPEFRDVKASEFAYRVHSGNLAQKYFTFGGQHIAGLYQQVGGIKPGTRLRFSVYMETWGCMAGEKDWNICPTGHLSNNPSPMHTKVGIDPTGDTNPWANTVVWGPEINAYDTWTLFQVDAVAKNNTVTVFTYSYADWFDNVFRMHNDVYIDDASLVVWNERPPTITPRPTATLDPSLPTATPRPTATTGNTPTPLATATLLPDGVIVHVVQTGDTLSAIAKRYQVPLAQIVQLNALTNTNVVRVGQTLVIATPEVTATPLPTDTPSPPPPTATPTSTTMPPTSTMLPTLQPTITPLPAHAMSVTPPATPSPLPSATPTPSDSALAGFWLLVIGIGIVIIVLVVVFVMLRNQRSHRLRL